MERAKIMSVEERTKMARDTNKTYIDSKGLKAGQRMDSEMAGKEEHRDVPKPGKRKDVRHPDTMSDPPGKVDEFPTMKGNRIDTALDGDGKTEGMGHKRHESHKRREHEERREHEGRRKGKMEHEGGVHIHHHHHYHGKE